MVKASGTIASEIKWMQAAMNACIDRRLFIASKLEVDASFGSASSRACKIFQTQFGLSVDGKFGPQTIAKMIYVLNHSRNKHNYLQVDSSWSNLTYNNSRLRDSGCGILSIVNAVYNSTGRFIEPKTVADWAYAKK